MIPVGNILLSATLIGGGQAVSPFLAQGATFLSVVAIAAGLTVLGSFIVTRFIRILL